MSIDHDKSIELFNERVTMQGNINSVLDAGLTKTARKSNLLHDYFSKKYVSSSLGLKSKDIVLDFGCGVGRLTKYLAPKVDQIIGYDASEKMIVVADEVNNGNNISYVSAINQITVSFDIIFSHWVLAHVSDEEIQNQFRVLLDKINLNGRIVIFEQIYHSLEYSVKNEVYYRRSLEDYKKVFETVGYQFISAKDLYRTPSYARSLWTRLPVFFKFCFPVFYLIEKWTIHYKPEHIEYTTTCMNFCKK